LEGRKSRDSGSPDLVLALLLPPPGEVNGVTPGAKKDRSEEKRFTKRRSNEKV
jgi:hypothetical protein